IYILKIKKESGIKPIELKKGSATDKKIRSHYMINLAGIAMVPSRTQNAGEPFRKEIIQSAHSMDEIPRREKFRATPVNFALFVKQLHTQYARVMIFRRFHPSNAAGQRIFEDFGVRIQEKKIICAGTGRALIARCGET